MFRSMCIRATLMVLAFNPLLRGGDIVEVRLLEERYAGRLPATQPASDATTLLSIKASVDASGDFHASCLVGDKTIRIDGNLKTMQDGARGLKIAFLHQDEFRPGAFNTESVTTHIDMRPGEHRVIGGLYGSSDAARIVVATIKPQLAEPNASED